MSNKTIIWIFALLSLAIAANAGMHNPETYWGYVYIEGVLAPTGTILTVESANTGEVFANQTLPYDVSYPGSYSVMIQFDDEYTGADEGAALDESLTWKVNGITATTPTTDTAETGKTNNNFRIDAVAAPSVSANMQYPASAYLLQAFNVNITLNNTGSGFANVTLANLSEASLSSDLPKTVGVAGNTTNQTTTEINASTCGQHTPTLAIDYYNLAGALAGTLNEQLSFSITGADLILSGISLSSSNPAVGDTISITSSVVNNGTLNITGFTARFYYDSTLISTIIYNDTILVNESVGLSANWNAVSGATAIKIELTTSGAECYTANNNMSSSITVSAAAQNATTSGAGGGGGGGITGNLTYQCNDGIDNDGDGLIDYPLDPGCDNNLDDDERDIAEDKGITGEGAAESNVTAKPEYPQEQEKEEVAGVMPSMTGFVVKAAKGGGNLLLLLILLILVIILYVSYKKGSRKPKQPKQPPIHGQQQRIKVAVYSKKGYDYAKAKEKPKATGSRKPCLIQKSIKISSKKEIIDRIKEVHEENG
jgi:hypothetical protein